MSNAAQVVSPAKATAPLIDWAEEIRPRLVSRAEEAERLRQLPAATIAEAREAGFFRMFAPRLWGGSGADLASFLDVVRVLARGCASSAWTLSFLANHAWILARFGRELQEELLSRDGYALCSAPLAPTGKAIQVEGGFRVTGRWEWASGVMHADWTMVTCMLPDGAAPVCCVLPLSDVTIADVWRTSGMLGTGSNTVVADDVFVPTHRSLDADLLKLDPPGAALHPEPTLCYPMSATLAIMAATPALGAAEQALEDFTGRMRQKLMAFSGGAMQGQQPSIHLRLGAAAAKIKAARLVWRDCIDTLEKLGPQGGAMALSERAEVRLGAAAVVKFSSEAIDELCAAAGASAYFLSSPLQRALRDVQMMRGHVVFDWDRTTQIIGRVKLDLPTTPADML